MEAVRYIASTPIATISERGREDCQQSMKLIVARVPHFVDLCCQHRGIQRKGRCAIAHSLLPPRKCSYCFHVLLAKPNDIRKSYTLNKLCQC